MSVRQAVFLVGGLGTRLGELTASTPKPMLPVAGRPLLDHLMQKAAKAGLNDIVLLAGHASEAIAAYLDQDQPARRFGLTIAVSVEPAPLGTAGAVINALPLLAEAFLLINGGLYRMHRSIFLEATGHATPLSLESDLAPDLCTRGLLGGQVFEGDFIDIGVPESYAAAQDLLA